MFNNADSSNNGEMFFFSKIKSRINIIFDVGCRYDSEFLKFGGIVHYFEPDINSLTQLTTQLNFNSKSYYNNFGLGNENKELYYYPKYQSFLNRTTSCGYNDDENKVVFRIQRANDYILQNHIDCIDFLKIDTEGFEFEVLKGFDTYLQNIKLIQFEYGGTFLDNKVKLIEVIDYLKTFGFDNFSYLSEKELVLFTNFEDHYQYCNIVCINNKYIDIFTDLIF